MHKTIYGNRVDTTRIRIRTVYGGEHKRVGTRYVNVVVIRPNLSTQTDVIELCFGDAHDQEQPQGLDGRHILSATVLFCCQHLNTSKLVADTTTVS